MSLISWIKGLRTAKDAGTSIADAVHRGQERKHGNKEKNAVREHEETIKNLNLDKSALDQFAKEFRQNRNWFDSLMDGINRLPRPLFAFSALSLYVARNSAPFVLLASGDIDYLNFLELIQQMMEDQKLILLTIIGFYFGGRFFEKKQLQQNKIDFSKFIASKKTPKKTWDFDELIKKHFSSISKKNLKTCHDDLQKICAVAVPKMDFSILEGTRTLADQQKYFSEGKSKLDGINKKSKHQSNPSMAIDIAPYPIDWNNEKRFVKLSAIMFDVAKELKESGEINHSLRWGGDWDGDGDRSDQKFDDLPHYEIV